MSTIAASGTIVHQSPTNTMLLHRKRLGIHRKHSSCPEPFLAAWADVSVSCYPGCCSWQGKHSRAISLRPPHPEDALLAQTYCLFLSTQRAQKTASLLLPSGGRVTLIMFLHIYYLIWSTYEVQCICTFLQFFCLLFMYIYTIYTICQRTKNLKTVERMVFGMVAWLNQRCNPIG